MADYEEIVTDILELEFRQQQLLEFTQRVVAKAIAAGWTVSEIQDETPNSIPRLTLLPPTPDNLP